MRQLIRTCPGPDEHAMRIIKMKMMAYELVALIVCTHSSDKHAWLATDLVGNVTKGEHTNNHCR